MSLAACFQPADHGKTEPVVELAELEGDTLDPQTGLFYRSNKAPSDPVNLPTQPAAAQPPPTLLMSQAEAEPSRPVSSPTQQQQQPPLTPPQLQSKPQISQPSSSTPPLIKKIPKPQDQTAPKPQPSSPSPHKDRGVTVPTQSAAKTPTPSTPTKAPVTPQLPKLQQAPSSHHRPLHAPMSHPPPLQAHHPVSTEKPASSQVSEIPEAADSRMFTLIRVT